MEDRFSVSRIQLIYALCLPLAVLMGYMLADPTDLGSIGVVLAVAGVLSIPILMRYYHPLLILAWNAAINPIFLPGRPFLWMLLAMVGLIFAVANRFTNPDSRFTVVPSLTKPILAILAVTLFTAWAHGGFNLRIFGGGRAGGRGYFFIIAAIAGYFTLTSQRIPRERANLAVSLFFLMGLTALISNLAFAGGPATEFLFYIFPTEYVLEQAAAEFSMSREYGRAYGLSIASIGLYCFLLARYGLTGILLEGKIWRMALFVLASVGCAFCGYRSFIGLFILTVGLQAYFEKLLKPRVVLGAIAGLAIAAAVIVPNADRLPLVVQRSLSILPIEINQSIRLETDASSKWRFEMWKHVLPTVPQYLLRGKGYSINQEELRFAEENARRGYLKAFEPAILSGDYHSGPLSLIIPFGIWGAIAFVWLMVSGLRFLYRNYISGDPSLKVINTFLLTYFVARLACFLFIFGGYYGDLPVFVGLLALSVSLNGSEPYKAKEPSEENVEEAFGKSVDSNRLPVPLR